ncbi:hypothetical protein ACTA71_011124 [Dictyostelium dimigraforme]
MSFLCSKNSNLEDKISIEIDKSIKEHRSIRDGEIQVLIYGQKKSGVTTFFKNFMNFSDDPISPDELKSYRNLVYKTIILQLKQLINLSNNLDIKLENDHMNKSNLILELDCDNLLWTKEIGENCLELWNDFGIQKIFENQYNCSFGYFFDNLNRISEENYTPTIEDVMNIKLSRNGIIETNFSFSGVNIKMIDIGIQNSTSKKWINCFGDICAIIYIIDISVYDLIDNNEDSSSINKLDKSLNDFKDIINSKLLSYCGMVVYFNKKDIFREKLNTVPFETYDKEYTGKNDFESTTNFIKNKILSFNPNPNKKIFFIIKEELQAEICMVTFKIIKDIVLDLVCNPTNLID